MISATGNLVIAFNGEIYNHLALRTELERAGLEPPGGWRGHSDTETLLAGCDTWGVEATLKKSVGMFAFALWDRTKRTLTLARDRMGEKPLYYGRQNGVFLFGSELNALRKHPDFEGSIDRNALTLYFRHLYIPGPSTIYSNIQKLTPGSILVVPTGSPDKPAQEIVYWSLVQATAGRRFAGSPDEAVRELHRQLEEAVDMQMVADVPIGAFLSGGIDSSTIVALMQAQSSRRVRTFTIGFEEAEANEAHYAARVARHLGTEHTELTVTAADALNLVPRLPHIWDEPFADNSQIPTFLLAQLTRRQVTVSLSGDGGDELFHGYDHYRLASSLERVPLKRTCAWVLRTMPFTRFARLWALMPHRAARRITPRRLATLSAILGEPAPHLRYRQLLSFWGQPEQLVVNGAEQSSFLTPFEAIDFKDFSRSAAMVDAMTYLRDDILVKLDRAAMSVSLETRIPLLDHRLVEFAFSLPTSYKLREGLTKWPLRKILHRYVPAALVDRPKKGFGLPIGAWLRGPLKEWANDLLSEQAIRRRGLLNSEPISRALRNHEKGPSDWGAWLWPVLMLQAWEAALT
jgi:asparagine synthase (glutamine-hydrolysing)